MQWKGSEERSSFDLIENKGSFCVKDKSAPNFRNYEVEKEIQFDANFLSG